jgi:GLPGLI family protein
MKKIIILAVSFLYSTTIFGQDNDSSIINIYYSIYSTKDLTTKTRLNEDFILSIGQNHTKYYSWTKYKRDSILLEAEQRSNKPSIELKGFLMTN